MAGLSVSLILLILCVVVPGYLFLGLSGKPSANGGRFWEAVLHGSAFFGGSLLWAACWDSWRGTRLVDGFLQAVAAVSAGEAAPTFRTVLAMLAFLYALMFVCAFGSLLFEAIPGLRRFSTAWRERLLRLRGFPGPADLPPVEVTPREPLVSLLLACRRARRRPYLKIGMAAGGTLEGECLRFSWADGGSFLIRDADDPGRLSWVRLAEVRAVGFDNLFVLGAEPEPEGRARLDPATGYILDCIVPGLAADTERRLRQRIAGER